MNRERAIRAFSARLARLPVAGHPALMFNPWLEGYRDYTFGGRAGPAVHISNLFHELGHAAQFGAEMFRTRASVNGYHFKVPTVFVYDRYCDEPRTNGATMRELDTFAYQLHLMEAAGVKVDKQAFSDYSAYVMRLMHDWYYIKGKTEEERKLWCSKKLLACYDKLTPGVVLGRLEEWLDATRARLNRQKLANRASNEVDQRLRPLLAPVTVQTRL